MQGADEVGVEGTLAVVFGEGAHEDVHDEGAFEAVLWRTDVGEIFTVAVVLHDGVDRDVEFDYFAFVGCGESVKDEMTGMGCAYQRRFF